LNTTLALLILGEQSLMASHWFWAS